MIHARSAVWLAVCLGELLFGAICSSEEPSQVVVGVDKPYRPTEELEGELRVVGSTTMSHLAALWGEGLSRFHPKLKVEIACQGSETAFPQLKGDKAILGVISRPVTEEEKKKIGAQLGRKIITVRVCADHLAVIVHKDNPVKALTLDQLRTLFGRSEEWKSGPAWGQIGLQDAWAERRVEQKGRDADSGTHVFFQRQVFGEDGSAAGRVKSHPSHRAVIKAVAEEVGAVGYCRLSHVGESVKVVPIVATAKESQNPPALDEAFGASYPLRREMSLVVALPEDKPLPPVIRDFLLYALSRDGQRAVLGDGFTPLSREQLHEQFDLLGVTSVK